MKFKTGALGNHSRKEEKPFRLIFVRNSDAEK